MRMILNKIKIRTTTVIYITTKKDLKRTIHFMIARHTAFLKTHIIANLTFLTHVSLLIILLLLSTTFMHEGSYFQNLTIVVMMFQLQCIQHSLLNILVIACQLIGNYFPKFNYLLFGLFLSLIICQLKNLARILDAQIIGILFILD